MRERERERERESGKQSTTNAHDIFQENISVINLEQVPF